MINLSFKKVLVAVDVFTDAFEVEQKLFDYLGHLLGDEAEICPVCLTSDLSIDGHHPFIEAELQSRMSRHTLADNVKAPSVITSHSAYPGYLSDRVKRLLEYATDESFDLIAVYTHSIEGRNDYILGSFIDPLIYNSVTPLLLVNPISHNIESVKKIFIPTHLDDDEVDHYIEQFEAGVFSDCAVHFHNHIYDHEHLILDKVESLKLHHQKRIEDAKSRLEKQFQKLKAFDKEVCHSIQLHIDISSEKETLSVEKCIENLNPDLVMLALKVPTTERWNFFHSGFARHVLRHSSTPVMTIPFTSE